MENSERDGNTRPPDLPREQPVCRSGSNRTGHGTTDWFQIGKGVRQGCTLSPCLFNLYAEYIMRNAGLEETQAGIKIAERNINNLRYADDTTLKAESEEELKSLLINVKVESEKVGLKLNIQKTKIMASSPITSWEIDRETVETVSDFIFLGSKITADGDCSHEIKRHLLLGRKVMTNLVAPHSSAPAWGIPWTGEPGGLQSVGLLGVRHNWVTSLSTFMYWRRKWQPTPVFLLGELESPLDCKEIQPVHSKGDQPWVFFGRNDAEAETPVFWPPHAKS